MSQSNIRSRYKKALKSSVEAKLESQGALIQDLEQQLSTARTTYNALKNELTPYLNDSSVIKPGPITCIPRELLVEMFKLYLGAAGHQCIRTLLLICRQWHHLVADTPSLWTTIHVKPPSLSVNCQTPYPYSQLLLYVKTCLQRCGTLPLDVLVDFGHHQHSAKEFAKFRVRLAVKPLVDTMCDTTSEWCKKLVSAPISGSHSVKLEYQQLRNALRLLIGPDGCHRSRWKTLKFFCLDWEDQHQALAEMLGEALPNLVSLEADTKIEQFNEIPSLRVLKYPNSGMRAFDGLSSQNIECLGIGSLGPSHFQLLGALCSLRELSYTPLCVRECSFPNSTNILKLPLLRRLILRSHVHTCTVQFDLPCLESLTLIDSLVTPDIPVPSLSLDLSENLSVRTALYELVYSLGTVQRLNIYGCSRDCVEEVLGDTRKANALTPGLQTVWWARYKGDDLESIRFTPAPEAEYVRQTFRKTPNNTRIEVLDYPLLRSAEDTDDSD
ncbi:hypothetical protein FRC16_002087 [Serendipita sp. 398]|nr:hypothetical protein FRC16_002087 [Serendipita sp. 398]